MSEAAERLTTAEFIGDGKRHILGEADVMSMGFLRPKRYVREDVHLAAIHAARIEGYEIARKEAAAMGCHLLRPDLVPALTQKPPE